MATTKETKPMFVYWAGKERGETTKGSDMYTVSYYRERGFTKPQYLRGFSSELVENLDEPAWEDLDEKAPVTLTVERGSANPSSPDGYYWNLLAIEVGHDSELWPDGAPEEAQAPAPKVVKQENPPYDQAEADDELADYINQRSDDHGQYRMNESEMREFGAQLGNAANTASRIYSAYIASSEKSVEFNEDRFAELIVKNFKGIAKAKQTILNERSAR